MAIIKDDRYANGAHQLAIVIPCHRIINSNDEPGE
jgi:O6-methylguanine-DNA--protein-cysteine methyltransferase